MDHPPPPASAIAPGRPSPDDVWRAPVAVLLARLDTATTGLDSAAARSRLAEHGLNEATSERRRPLVLQFLARFRNPLIIILLIASAMSAATGDVPSFVIIAAIVLLSITLDFVQEVRAQSAVEALRRSVAVQATVRRDGHAVSVPIDQLVPGDVAELIAGDLVPADGRLLESRDLYVNQALLTGEPYPAEKLASDTASGADNPTGASNAVFAGTSVISGTAVVLVCRTGAQTALGNLATSLSEKPPASAFAVGIRRFGMLIMRFTIFMVLFVLVVNLSFHRSRLVDAAHATAVVGDETDLVFSGFAVFLDPPKASAGATIRAMAVAGVAVKVLTGDNEQVSRHVFQEIGVPVTGVLTGAALERMSDEALIGQLPQVNLFCRINPQQKHRVLLALKRLGHVVGFMGDGINDAPALHAADVGISVDGAADVARAAADLILLDPDLSVVREAMVAGRRTVLNVSKYVLMGASSNFGNMFSMAGAALILPFLPMPPIQILLNNLIYNVSEVAIPFDSVDAEAVTGPVTWDVTLVQRFMLVFGPISSIFDFVTFYAMLRLFGADQALFQTGWFIESMVTQALVVFCIRTRRVAFRSLPGRFLIGTTLGAVVLAVLLPMLPVGHWFGFVPPPPLFFAYLIAATLAYLALVEVAKVPFYRMLGRRTLGRRRAR
jgi:magnesium-transporting ATPase (P-type)